MRKLLTDCFAKGFFADYPTNQKREHISSFPWSVFILAALLLLLAGCNAVPGFQPTEEDLPSGAVLFADDFSDPSGGWGIGNRDGVTIEYMNGGLRFLIKRTHFDTWSVTGQIYEDTQAEVDVTNNSGLDNNDFGLICRYQDQDNFYMLVGSSDGYYGIAKVKEGKHSMIGADQLQYSDLIQKGAGPNHLRADCIGSTLTLSINGQKLMQVQDADFASGDVGLLAGAYDTQGVDLIFHQFIVKKP
jgi:hypothetical protein